MNNETNNDDIKRRKEELRRNLKRMNNKRSYEQRKKRESKDPDAIERKKQRNEIRKNKRRSYEMYIKFLRRQESLNDEQAEIIARYEIAKELKKHADRMRMENKRKKKQKKKESNDERNERKENNDETNNNDNEEKNNDDNEEKNDANNEQNINEENNRDNEGNEHGVARLPEGVSINQIDDEEIEFDSSNNEGNLEYIEEEINDGLITQNIDEVDGNREEEVEEVRETTNNNNHIDLTESPESNNNQNDEEMKQNENDDGGEEREIIRLEVKDEVVGMINPYQRTKFYDIMDHYLDKRPPYEVIWFNEMDILEQRSFILWIIGDEEMDGRLQNIQWRLTEIRARTPLSKETFRRMKTHIWKNVRRRRKFKDFSCPICMDGKKELDSNDETRNTKIILFTCHEKHMGCYDCMEQYFKHHNNCPLCKKIM